MILYVSRKFPPSIGGMQWACYHLSEELGRLTETRRIVWGGPQAALPAFLPYAFVRALVELARSQRVSAILLGDCLLAPLGAGLKRLTGLPVITSAHGMDVFFELPIYRALMPRSLRQLDLVVCNSARVREACLGHGVQPDRCAIVPVGAARLEPVESPASRTELARLAGCPDESTCFLLTVGRLVPRKGVRFFVEAVLPKLIAHWPAVQYVVVGDGPEREVIRAAARRVGVGDRLTLLGEVRDRRLLAAVYAGSDVFVMPNVPVAGEDEGFGMVAVEAAMAGLPVVASRLGGIPDAVADGEGGRLVPPGDADAYVAAVGALLADGSYRRQLGQAGQRIALAQFTWDRIARRYLDLLVARGFVRRNATEIA